MVKINCVVIFVSFLESELFGYDKGVFIGVINIYCGCFEIVDGGMLFFDEIGDISLMM